MRILITGAAGFIGTRLSAALLARDTFVNAAGNPVRLRELILADRAQPPSSTDPRVRCLAADVGDPQSLVSLLREEEIDGVFALAATLTVEAETDFENGLRVNLHGLLSLLEACRSSGRRPRFVFPSSIAAFGGPLPDTVDDQIQLTPQTSYGTHKAVGELLVNDYTRRGFIDGRSLRLPVVLVRPGAASPARGDAKPAPAPTVSGAIAAIVRDRLAGLDVVIPLDPDTKIAAASIDSVIDALIAVHELPGSAFGHTRAMNLPSLTISLRELAEATDRVAGQHGIRAGGLQWAPDPTYQSAVDQWPRGFVSELASRLGIRSDPSADAIVAGYLREYGASAGTAT